MVGQMISHYKILEKLGEGGMGVVYKAEDTKLTRTVALKFLPPGLDAHEPERARFLQEARAAAILNHPNICTIHDIQEVNGQQFIVMEYVEGKTLRNIIPVTKIQDAVGYAIQIAEALQEAHAHGIVHRDIKAENIMVNAKNQVKVMDFGLAQLKGSLKLTRTTSTVGTLAYMPPEQIQGGMTDARSDIFSFGVVLYETLTGHLPFHGAHEAAMVYSIVNEEPDPVQKYIPTISSELVHIINRSLEKDPADRYQTMSDVVIDLKRLRRTTTHVSLPVIEQARHARFSRTAYLVAGGGLLVVLAALALLLWPKRSHAPGGPMVTRALKLPNLTVNSPNISPDGNWIVFLAEDAKRIPNLYIVHASGGEAKQVTQDTAYVTKDAPCFSPDASQIAYQRTLYGRDSVTFDILVVPALGGASRRFISGGLLPIWSPDGNRIAFFRAHMKIPSYDLFVANADGTEERRIVTITPVYFFNVAWSPDSRNIAFLKSFPMPNGERYTEIFVRSLEDSSERQITFDKKIIDDFCWTPTDEIVYNSTRGGNLALWAIPARGGTPAQVTLGGGSDRFPRVSRNGRRLVYVNESETSNLWRVSLADGQINQLTFEEAYLYLPSYAPDGARIAFYHGEQFETWRSGVVISNRDGADASPVTLSLAGYHARALVRWTPDGKSMVLNAWFADTVRRNPDSVVARNCILEHDPVNAVTKKICAGFLMDASKDGKYLLYGRDGDTASWRRVLTLMSDPEKVIREIPSPWGLTQFAWDSKSVITQDSLGIWFYPVEKGKSGYLIKGTKKILLVSQMPDGKSLLATDDPTGKTVNTLVRFEISSGKTEKICQLPTRASPWGGSSTLSPDGKSLVFYKFDKKNRIVVLDNFREASP
jgi:serine/threonine protein kinase